MQMFYNLLPEFGSLPWTLKPVLVLVAEQCLSPNGRRMLMALVAAATAILWIVLAAFDLHAVPFLVCTGFVSLGSAMVDGLVDGRMAAEGGSDPEKASRLQYICQIGQTIGSLYVGLIAWTLGLSRVSSVCLTAAGWAAAGACIQFGPPAHNRHQEQDEALSAVGLSTLVGTWHDLASLASRTILLVAFVTFVVCLSPSLDTFLFRQHVVGILDSQQPLMSVAGTFGWFLGTTFYKMYISKGRSPEDALRMSLLIWPFSSLVTVLFVLSSSGPSAFVLCFAFVERASCEFGKALTFFPTKVLHQLHASRGCEGTACTLMEAGGTIGMVLARNLEWIFMGWYGVDPKSGARGFDTFWCVCLAALAWRVGTALATAFLLAPVLVKLSARKAHAK